MTIFKISSMNLSFLKSLFLILILGACTSYSCLATAPSNDDSTSLIKKVVLLHQEDGSFHEKEYLTAQPPIPTINVPLGSTIQIELLGAECRYGSEYTFITRWDLDSEFTDSLTTKWDCILNQEIQPNIDPRDSSRWPSDYTKKFTFVFQTLHLGETTLHFERRQLNSDDNFKPNGYDNLFFNINVVEPAPLKAEENN